MSSSNIVANCVYNCRYLTTRPAERDVEVLYNHIGKCYITLYQFWPRGQGGHRQKILPHKYGLISSIKQKESKEGQGPQLCVAALEDHT